MENYWLKFLKNSGYLGLFLCYFLYLVEYQYNKILKLISSYVALSTAEVEKMQESYLTNVDTILTGVPTIVSAYILGVIFYLKVLIRYL